MKPIIYNSKAMKAAIFFSGKYGSTRQYAQWLGESTGLPVYDLRKDNPEILNYDLLILGTSIVIGKPTIAKWMKTHWEKLWGRNLLLFSVSGTKPGHPDLQTWMHTRLGEEILSQVDYVPLRGRLNPAELPWWVRAILKMGARVIKDPAAKKRMSEGFDYMDRNSISPILKWYEAQIRSVSTKEKEPELTPV